MPALLSLVTSIKDYIEIAHKLVETQNTNFFLESNKPYGLSTGDFFGIRDYNEFGAVLTYLVLSVKEFFANFFTFTWLKTIWSLPLIVPDVASAMISEISVLDSYFTNAFSFLENGVSNNLNSNANTLTSATENLVNAQKIAQNPALFGFEKFIIGFFNSFFLFLPTSTAHLITLRRFVMQGIEAGFIAGLGTIAGNFVWLASIILGLRFIVIPWLSLDIFRYLLGFMLLVKYLWDSSKELNKTSPQSGALAKNEALKIFTLNFLLALTEQTSIYPFISNMSFGADGSILEGFTATGFSQDNPFLFFGIHGCYLLGIVLGSFSLLQFTVWFWENPAFSLYMWMISSYRVTTSSYYKVLNFVFLYLTMLCAISSVPYFGLDYTVTKPLGMIPQDRIIEQRSFSASGPGEPILPETSFLGVKPTDKNTRIRDGVHARRERWKERLIKYQAFDASLYDQGVYDILTVEDLNYGFDRFWLRRKMRNHQIRFRLFPGPWMRSLKKQLNKPGFTGPRTEFFRILFEQYYHPSFHATVNKSFPRKVGNNSIKPDTIGQGTVAFSNNTNILVLAPSQTLDGWNRSAASPLATTFKTKKGLISEYSALRKFSRNVNTRLITSSKNTTQALYINNKGQNSIYSKSLKALFNSINKEYTKPELNLFRNLSKNLLLPATGSPQIQNLKKTSLRKALSKKERLLLINQINVANLTNSYVQSPSRKAALKKAKSLDLSMPIKESTTVLGVVPDTTALNYYFQKNEAFKRKLQFYSTAVTRKFSVGNNAPYFKTLLKRAFYYHKPTLRWKRTMFAAAMRRGFRKKSVMPKKLVYTTSLSSEQSNLQITALDNGLDVRATPTLAVPSQQYSVLGKRASRYRYQIYKDVLQHWYYTPFNRLLLKFDIDAFVARQPKSQFLTKKEERLLHLRRVLLSEHYNTLRWYTYMQHYRTMKSRIGGTKSFASTVYNQQFQGTFKKIRHLFAITPIQTNSVGSILQFDQPLYNSKTNLTGDNRGADYQSAFAEQILKNKGVNFNSTTNVTNNKIVTYKHEELEKSKVNSFDSATTQNVIEESLNATGLLVKEEQAIKSATIKRLKEEKNFSALTAILATPEFSLLETSSSSSIVGTINREVSKKNLNNLLEQDLLEKGDTKLLLLDLLKETKKRLNDQTFLKNYISHRIDKREQRSKETSKEFKNQLETLKTWLSPSDYVSPRSYEQKTYSSINENRFFDTTTGVRKGLTDGILVLNNYNPAYVSTSRQILTTKLLALRKQNSGPLMSKALLNSKKLEIKQTFTSIQKLSNLVNNLKTDRLLSGDNRGADYTSKTQLSKYLLNTVEQLQSLIKTVLKPLILAQNKLLTKRTQKNLEWWRQKQRVLNKRSSSRKKERLNLIESNISSQPKKAGLNAEQQFNSYLLPNYSDVGADSNLNNKVNTLSLRGKGGKTIIPEVDLTSQTTLSTENVLRKKTVENNSENNLLRNNFREWLLRKFRKKRSRGKNYRKAYFGSIIRPKNANSVPTSNESTDNYLKNMMDYYVNPISLSGVLDQKAYKELSNTKPSSISSFSDYNSGTSISESKDEKSTSFKAFKAQLVRNIVKINKQNGDNRGADYKQSNVFGTINEDAANKVANFKTLLIGDNRGADYQSSIKKSPSKKRSRRTWRKRKRQKFSINHDRYRKRQNHGLGKLRNLAKKMKRIQSTQEFQNWWWNTYLPNYVARGANINNSKATTPSQKATSSSLFGSNARYAPLSTAKALDIKQSIALSQSNSLLDETNQNLGNETNTNKSELLRQNSTDILDKIYDNLVSVNNTSIPLDGQSPSSSLELPNFNSFGISTNSTTTIPFYAGWDESLRKFIITNRLLSRRDSGFEVNLDGILVGNQNSNKSSLLGQSKTTHQALQFTNAPIKGLNEASFLYLQTEMPFNSYTIDQFIPNNQSFYAPLGWKRFQFRHTLLKNWHSKTNGYNVTSNNSWTSSNTLGLSQQNKEPIYLTNDSLSNLEYFRGNSNILNGSNSIQKSTAGIQNRRIKKRYKLLRETLIKLMYVPTGALLTETLPSHYISVFDKQYRFPRNRYIKRNLPKANKANTDMVKNLTIADYSNSDNPLRGYRQQKSLMSQTNQTVDFTLRKRIKPKRKYHKKRFTKKDGLIFPRRRKFGTSENNPVKMSDNAGLAFGDPTRLRPSTRANQNIKGFSKSKKQGRNSGKANPIRLRQLRRREFQQVYKPLQRYQPRYGGFTWPGDYLRLQIVPMPKLETTVLRSNASETLKSSTTPTKVKAKINAQPIGLLPRKYLLQKHNLKVFKKKIALHISTAL